MWFFGYANAHTEQVPIELLLITMDNYKNGCIINLTVH